MSKTLPGPPWQGAEITLLDDAGTVKAKTTTNSAGQFSIPGVLPGKYVLEAERKMFETSREQISVSEGKPPPDLQIVMKVATRRETVDVFQQEGYAVMATRSPPKRILLFSKCRSLFRWCLKRFSRTNKSPESNRPCRT